MQPLIDKVCRKCGETKPLSSFHPHKQCRGGVTGTCRTCSNNKTKQWYSENRARRQEVANKNNQTRKRMLVDHFGDQCYDCKATYPQYVYEFHHLDPSKKDVNPSKALTWSEERMWEELNKCIMLCANCHKIRHWGKS